MAKNINLPPATKDQLVEIYEKLIQPTFNDISLNLITFKGSGISAGMKYVLRNRKKYKGFDQTTLFYFIDLSHFSENPEQIAAEALSFAIETADKESRKVLKKFSPETFTLQSFMELIRTTTYDKKHRAVFIIEAPEYLHKEPYARKVIKSWVKSLGSINPMNCAFIFLTKAEDTKYDIGQLSANFTQQKVSGQQLLVSKDSSLQAFDTAAKWYNEEYEDDIVDKVITESLNDPSVIRTIIKTISSNQALARDIKASTDTKSLYKILGREMLNNRYYQIVKYLEEDSLNELVDLTNPTEFLLTSGLVNETSYLNPLFEYFCKNYLTEYIPGIINQIDPEVLSQIKEGLSGVELGVFNLLFTHLGKIVPRDDVADVMWGEEWTHKYSDQAIDKLASNLRRKLLAEGLSLKSAKGTGFILSQD